MAEQDKVAEAQRLIAEMQSKYGGAAPKAAEAPPKPAPAPAPQQKQEQPGSLLMRAAGLLRGRNEQIDKAAGYACGGKVKAHATGGKIKTIKGPGTSTSDSIPANVKETGEKILVSNGERILSKKQDQLLGKIAKMLGYASTDELLASGTGRPVGPTMKDGKKGLSDGGTGAMDPEEKKWRLETGNLVGTYSPANIYKDVGVGSANTNPPVVPPGETPRQQKDFSGEFLGGLKNWMASKTPIASEEEAAKLRAVDDPFIVGPGAVSRTMMRQAGNALLHEPLVESPAAAKKLVIPGKPEMSADQNSPSSRMIGAAPQSTPENYTGEKTSVSPLITGRNDKNIITADTAKAAYGNDMARLGGIFGSYDGSAVNDILARENKARSDMINSMIAANGGNGAAILGEVAPGVSRADMENEAKTRKWAVDDALLKYGPAGAHAMSQMLGLGSHEQIARMANNAAMYGHAVNAQRASGHDQTLLDVEKMRQAGNPNENRLKAATAAEHEQMARLRGELLDPNISDARKEQVKKYLLAIGGKNADQSNIKIAEETYPDPNNPMNILKRTYAVGAGADQVPIVPIWARQPDQKFITADQKKAIIAGLPSGMKFEDYAKANNIVVR